jgi:diguanylate cyclase (GGDEF)-like protein
MNIPNTWKISNQDSIIQRRIDMDLLNRSIPGILILAVILPVGIFWPYNFFTLHPAISWSFTGGMIGISLIRLGHKFISNYLYSKSPRVWLASFAMLSISHASLLSLLMILTIIDPDYKTILFPVMLAVCGIASGAVVSLSPRITLSLIYLLILLVPGILFKLNAEEQFASVPIMIVYFVFLTGLGLSVHKEYIRGFYIETQLNSQQEELEKLNKLDPLTQIYNKGHFNNTYRFQWNNGIRNNIELSILLIDLDHFKSINDQFGHLFGDECLINIAKVISTVTKRSTDLIARFGGEEFIVLLNGTSSIEAFKLAERIRSNIESEVIVFNDIALKVTASIGVATMLPQLGINANNLIENADNALYKAKENGRNCVIEYNNT